MEKAYIFIDYNNIVVLKDYLEVVRQSLKNVGFSCEYIKKLDGLDKKSLIVFPMAKDAFKYYIKGYHNFAIWQQGATADESYMRNHSKIRYNILNYIDVFCMKKARFILFVSDYMKHHYEELANHDFTNKSYIMPCFNEELDKSALLKKDYSKKIFTYVGSLDLWQCFDKTAKLYAEIEKRFADAQFKVLTFQVDEAKKILSDMGVKNYSVKQVPKEEVKDELSECTYGFIIRENNMVNRVATPTKISSYLSVGVLPIFSSCLIDFSNLSEAAGCSLSVEDNFDYKKIIEYIEITKDESKIKNSIQAIFSNYYSKENHIIQMENLIKKIWNIEV